MTSKRKHCSSLIFNEKYDYNDVTYYLSKCICIISSLPVYTVHKDILTNIMAIINNYKANRLINPDKLNFLYLKDHNNTYTVIKEYSILEYYFGFVLNSLKGVKDNRSFYINSIGNNLGKKSFLTYHVNNNYGYPICNYDMAALVDKFNIDDLIKVYMALMMEYKLILVFNDYSEINTIIFSLVSLLYPLKWSFPLISYLTDNLVETLEAPFGILIGAHVQYIPIIELKLSQGVMTDETMIYNLTTKSFISFPEKFPDLPPKMFNEIKANIYKFLAERINITNDIDIEDTELAKLFEPETIKKLDCSIYLNLKMGQIFFNVFIELVRNLESSIYFNKVKSLIQAERKLNIDI
jgi:hypothetical protein